MDVQGRTAISDRCEPPEEYLEENESDLKVDNTNPFPRRAEGSRSPAQCVWADFKRWGIFQVGDKVGRVTPEASPVRT